MKLKYLSVLLLSLALFGGDAFAVKTLTLLGTKAKTKLTGNTDFDIEIIAADTVSDDGDASAASFRASGNGDLVDLHSLSWKSRLFDKDGNIVDSRSGTFKESFSLGQLLLSTEAGAALDLSVGVNENMSWRVDEAKFKTGLYVLQVMGSMSNGASISMQAINFPAAGIEFALQRSDSHDGRVTYTVPFTVTE